MHTQTYLVVIASLGALLLAPACGDTGATCGPFTVEVDGQCVLDDLCPDGMAWDDAAESCVAVTVCATGTVDDGSGNCVPDGSVICETGTTYNSTTGKCDADITGCASGTVVVDGECRDPADVTPDVTEPAEPNGVGTGETPGNFTMPAVDEAITIGGCVVPTDDGTGTTVSDYDAFVFSATEPTLLNITVDGYGGAAGAFQMFSLEDPLFNADWQRFGVSLTSDMSQRQVFLPMAGDYVIMFTDSRSLFIGPAGGPGACYLATIRHEAMPSPTAITDPQQGSFGNDTLFLSYTPSGDDEVLFTTTNADNSSAMVDTVLMVNNEYRNSSAGFSSRGFGDPADNTGSDLDTGDTVVFVIDPVMNISLDPVDYDLAVSKSAVAALPTDGSTVSQAHPGDSGSLDSLLAFQVANDGDVKYIDLDVSALGDGDPDVDIYVLDANLKYVATVTEYDTTGLHAGWFYFQSAGTYYLEIDDYSTNTTDPFDVIATQIDHSPAALTVDTPLTGETVPADGARFYTVTPGSFAWWVYSGVTQSGGVTALNTDLFDASGEGQLLEDVDALESIALDTDVKEGRVLDNAPAMLIMVRSDGNTFDFSVAARVYTDLGNVTDGSPVSQNVTGSAAEVMYLVNQLAADEITITITGQNGLDPILVLLDKDENETVIDDNTGADTTEQSVTISTKTYTAFAVRDAAGSGGDYTVDVSVRTPLTGSSAPGTTIPDNDPTGIDDTINIASTCTVASISVDVNVGHHYIGDVILKLTSPNGTEVLLHNRTGGSSDDIIGNYPATLTPDGNLGDFTGEEAMGDWTIKSIASTNWRVKKAEQAHELIAQFDELRLIDVVMHTRSVFDDAMTDGRGVVEMSNEKAQAEIKAVAEVIYVQTTVRDNAAA